VFAQRSWPNSRRLCAEIIKFVEILIFLVVVDVFVVVGVICAALIFLLPFHSLFSDLFGFVFIISTISLVIQ